MGLTGRIFNLQRCSMHDGPGLRTTVFMKGCPLDCAWCHNPEGIAPEPQVLVNPERCIRCGTCARACDGSLGAACSLCGDCSEACPTEARRRVGEDVEVRELVARLLRDLPFYEASGGGITFSGGEPLLQAAFVAEVLDALGALGVHRALDTSGFAPWPDLLRVARRAELVLYDLKLADDARHLAATGVEATPILENLERLGAVHPCIWVRVPVIPGVNDDEDSIEAIARHAAAAGAARLDLLPFHATGAPKAARLARPFPALSPPSEGLMAELAAAAARHLRNVTIGGRS